MLAAFIVFGCQQANTAEKTDTIPTTKMATYAVSKQQAFQANANYVHKMKMLEPADSNPVRAFTVRSEDFLELLDIKPEQMPKDYHSHVRIYLGYENGMTKLYFTPVKGAKLSGDSISGGEDLYWDGPYEGNPSGGLTAGNGEYLFDFTKPCPTTCPE